MAALRATPRLAKSVDEWRWAIRTTKAGGSEEVAYLILQHLWDYNLASPDEESTRADIENLARALHAWAREQAYYETLRARHAEKVEIAKHNFEEL